MSFFGRWKVTLNTRRAAIFPTLLLALVVFLLAWQSASGYQAPDRNSPLAKLLLRYLREEPAIVSAEDRQQWIDRFEAAVAGAPPSDPGTPDTLLVLARLYLATGTTEDGIQILTTLVRDEKGPPNVRALSGLVLLSTVERRNVSSEELFSLAQEVAPLLKSPSLARKGGAFDFDLALLYVKATKWLLESTQRSLSSSEQGNNTPRMSALAVTESLAEAKRLLDEFSVISKRLPPNSRQALGRLGYSPEYLVLLKGEWFLAAGIVAPSEEKPDLYNQGVEALLRLLRKEGLSEYVSQTAAVISLKLVERARPSEYTSHLETILPLLKGGELHILTNELSDAAMRLSRTQSRRLGNEVFDTLFAVEEKWFPDEYMSHVNYQVGLLESTVNSTQMNDFEAVDRKLDLLEKAGVQDKIVKQRLGEVARDYAARLEVVNRLPPTDSSGIRPFFIFLNGLVILVLIALFILRRRRQEL